LPRALAIKEMKERKEMAAIEIVSAQAREVAER